MKWNDVKIRPPVFKDLGWMTESKTVLCEVSFIDENDKLNRTFCTCTFNTYKQSVTEEWQPIIDHLTVSTMPLADFTIEPADNFKVLSWTEIEDDSPEY